VSAVSFTADATRNVSMNFNFLALMVAASFMFSLKHKDIAKTTGQSNFSLVSLVLLLRYSQ
jgi:hypothetical protein